MGIFKLLNRILKIFLKEEADRKKILKIVVPSLFIHFIAGILYILTWLLLTRRLGARDYGILTYSFTIITLIVNLPMNSINVMAVREPPALLSKGQTGLWKGFYLWSLRYVLIVSITVPILIGAFILIATNYFHLFSSSPYTTPVLYFLAGVPFYCLMNYYSSWLRGQYKIAISFLPDNIVKPIFFLIILVCFLGFTVSNAIIARIISFVIGSVFAMALFYRATNMRGITPEYDPPAWKSSMKSLFFIAALAGITTKLDILMLGFYRGAAQVGIYNGADRVASSILFFQSLMNHISTAYISKLYALNDKVKLQKMITKITRWVTVISVVVFLVIVFFGNFILSVQGHGFARGQMALVIIAIGHLISVAFGAVANILITTKNERITVIFMVVRIALIILLNVILTPIFGLNGTAIATAISMILWNAGMFITVKRRTGLNTWIFG